MTEEESLANLDFKSTFLACSKHKDWSYPSCQEKASGKATCTVCNVGALLCMACWNAVKEQALKYTEHACGVCGAKAGWFEALVQFVPFEQSITVT